MRKIKYLIFLVLLLLPLTAFGAIARDDTNKISIFNSGCSPNCTFSFTVPSTANRVLIVDLTNFATGKVITNVQYNGSPMTTMYDSTWNTGGAYHTYSYFLVNPTAGTNNLTFSTDSGTNTIVGYAVTYTGAAQSSPNATSTNTGSGTSLAVSLNTITDNSWVHFYGGSNQSSVTAGAGSTRVCAAGSSAGSCDGTLNSGDGIFDSNGPVTPAGAYSSSFSPNASANLYYFAEAIAPAVSAPAASTHVISGHGVDRTATGRH